MLPAQGGDNLETGDNLAHRIRAEALEAPPLDDLND